MLDYTTRLPPSRNYQYDNTGQVSSGKRCLQDGAPVAGRQFESAFEDIGNRKTAGRGGDGQCIPHSGIDPFSVRPDGPKDESHVVETLFDEWCWTIVYDSNQYYEDAFVRGRGFTLSLGQRGQPQSSESRG
jgi:hypothetical protein